MGQEQRVALTRQVDERQIGDVTPADLEAHAVDGKRELAILGVDVVSFQELPCVDAWVEDGALSAADPFLYIGLIENRLSEPLIACLAQGLADLVCREAQGYDAPPWLA